MNTEYNPVVDEMCRVNAHPVKSEFELAIDKEVAAFIERVGLYDSPVSVRPRWKTDKEMYTAFWNERLN
jgi:hypothetical protein